MEKPLARDQEREGLAGASAAPSGAGCDGGDLGIRIGRDGTWFYHNSPIRRTALVKLFSTVLRREADGGYWLVTPVERGRVPVEDVPFVAVELRAAGDGRAQRLDVRTNLDVWVEVGADHPLRPRAFDGADVPYVEVRPGLEARLARAPFYHLAELAVDEPRDGRQVQGVWSRGLFFPLERTDS